ncbi:hypothetical protein HPB48_018443 [Haemaphysalis longicornis]|uniref:Uncharacterized protein n=1 Tax=Haemaphysalis longicornis TaxID=44386 RepID=A0A9J6GBP1_HAELO|nr:hypothetical protein HPB48_018443 [Haemaphysalis longicornis]
MILLAKVTSYFIGREKETSRFRNAYAGGLIPPFHFVRRKVSGTAAQWYPGDRWDYDIADRRDSIVSRFNLVCDRQYLYGLSFVAAILANAVFSPLAGFRLRSLRAGSP